MGMLVYEWVGIGYCYVQVDVVDYWQIGQVVVKVGDLFIVQFEFVEKFVEDGEFVFLVLIEMLDVQVVCVLFDYWSVVVGDDGGVYVGGDEYFDVMFVQGVEGFEFVVVDEEIQFVVGQYVVDVEDCQVYLVGLDWEFCG